MIDTVVICLINRDYSSDDPSLGLALIRTIKIGTENFRNDEIRENSENFMKFEMHLSFLFRISY